VAYLVVKYMAYGTEFETEELQPADIASGWKNGKEQREKMQCGNIFEGLKVSEPR